MTKFINYSSIENSYRQKEINTIRELGFHKVEWVATEKVHGCLHTQTKISMADGSQRSIGDIVRNKITDKVLGVDSSGKIIETQILNWFDNGAGNNWLKVKFSINRMERGPSYGVIQCTENHKFYNGEKYIPAKDMKVGSPVIRKRAELSIPYFVEQVLTGKMLGDGSYSNRSISFGHKIAHKEYLDYTMKCLGNFSGNNQKDRISGYGTQMCRGRSISSFSIEALFSNWFDKNNTKIVPENINLSPVSLAFWYMDDGSISDGKDQNFYVSIATNGFDENSVQNLLVALGRMGIFAKKYNSDGWRIKIDSDNSHKLFTLISPYVPEVMQYKLPKYFRAHNYIPTIIDSEFKVNTVEQEILSIEKIKNNHIKYDIETETHNFFANNILVHNSNFSLWNIDGQVVPGKRSGFADGSFYGCQSIVENLTPKVKAVGMTIFGEIFGHGVQKGVNYGPKRFAAFDILEGKKYINYDKFVELCDTNGIDRCVEIARGSFEDLLQIDATFVTKMSVNETTDIAEGFVMKPVECLYYHDGSRVILKKKTEKFQERCTGPKPKVDITLTDAQQSLLNLAASYVNQERVESAISKYGEDVKFPTILGEVLKDIHGELLKDEEVDISTWNSINKQVCSLISPIIRAKLFGGTAT